MVPITGWGIDPTYRVSGFGFGASWGPGLAVSGRVGGSRRLLDGVPSVFGVGLGLHLHLGFFMGSEPS